MVFATKNQNKIKELQSLLTNIHLLGLNDIGCFEEIPETSDTIEGNAIQKCEYVSKKYNVDCFADDTGLMVDALNGRPGVYSARYAGDTAKDEDNVKKLLNALEGIDNRAAQFKTIIALSLKNTVYTFEGICKGHITLTQKGSKGFGYDPIFTPEGFDKNFAEMSLEEKNNISHRAKATKVFLDFLKNIDWHYEK